MGIAYVFLVQKHKFNLGDSVVGRGAVLFKATKLALYLSLDNCITIIILLFISNYNTIRFYGQKSTFFREMMK